MIILGLHGPFESGKDTIAEFLHEEFGALVVPYAEPVRRGLLVMDPLIPISPENQLAIGICPETGTPSPYLGSSSHLHLAYIVAHYGWNWTKKNCPEVRRLLQMYGTEAGRNIHGTDCWTKIHGETVMAHQWPEGAGRIVVTPDLRFENEHIHGQQLAQQIERKAYANRETYTVARYAVWVVDRPDRRPTEHDNHASEVWHPPDEDVTCKIINDGTLEDLRAAVRRALLKTMLQLTSPARIRGQLHNPALYSGEKVAAVGT